MSDEETIFEQALRIEPPAERAEFLNRACADRPQLRQRLDALLQAHAQTAGILESPPIRPPAAPSPLEQPGAVVGNYKLLEQIGEGGMGVVYMAEQVRPVKRRVALKIIKPGLDTKQVIARFEAERQALAMMDHPSIAKVFDAGTTETGRPYFVMELVRGVPITEYCDQHHLTPRQRLELFVQVCQAVQHAHQKGIIHRDLKPNNVLVTLQDNDKPIPKVIDFGIAKATGEQRLTDRTLFTEFRQLIGTPLYMSPEQAEMSQLTDVDTRSDVYSLGVLLYELLTSTTPFDKQRLAKAAYDEVRRIIREEEPPRPSTRLSTLGQTLTSISAQRQTDPKKLSQTVRGELDWIVMKSLEKDRARRYETANGLARDVERYLTDQPVEACPPSRVYRMRKVIRRNKPAIAMASALAGMLLAATAISGWQAARATRARAAADRAAETARQTAASFQRMLASADPAAANGADYTVIQMLDNVAPRLDTAFADQPEVEAALRSTIGLAYLRLGHAEKAARHLARAVELRRRLYGDNSEKFAEALVDYANCRKEQGWYQQWSHAAGARAFFTPAEADVRKALDIYRQRGVSGERVIGALYMLQALLESQGRHAESEATGKKGLEAAAQSPGNELGQTGIIYSKLADAKIGESAFDESETLTNKSMEILQRVGGHPSDVGWDLTRLGLIRSHQERFAEAIVAIEQSLEIFRRVYPPHHWAITGRLGGISNCLRRSRKRSLLLYDFPQPEKLAEVEDFFWRFLPTEPSAMDGLVDLVGIYDSLGAEYDSAHLTTQASAARQKSVQLSERLRKELANDPLRLGALLQSQKKFADAVAAYDDALKRQPNSAELWASRGECHFRLGDFQQMRDDYSQAIRIDPNKQWYWHERGYADVELGDHKNSIIDHSKAIELSDKDAGQRYRRGVSYEAMGELQKAKDDYSRAIEINPYWGNWFTRARLNARTGNIDQAKSDLAEAAQRCPDSDIYALNTLAWYLATNPRPVLRDPKTAVSLANQAVTLRPKEGQYWNTLGVAYYRAADYAKAIQALEKSRQLGDDEYFSTDAFFFAMAHWQLGDKAEARRWYDQSIDWMDKHQPHDEELLRFRAEADALINPKTPASAPARTATTSPASK